MCFESSTHFPYSTDLSLSGGRILNTCCRKLSIYLIGYYHWWLSGSCMWRDAEPLRLQLSLNIQVIFCVSWSRNVIAQLFNNIKWGSVALEFAGRDNRWIDACLLGNELVFNERWPRLAQLPTFVLVIRSSSISADSALHTTEIQKWSLQTDDYFYQL